MALEGSRHGARDGVPYRFARTQLRARRDERRRGATRRPAAVRQSDAAQGTRPRRADDAPGRRCHARRQTRRSRALAQPGLFARRDPDVGPRHRRQHGCLLRRRSAPAAAAAVPRRRPTRDGRRVGWRQPARRRLACQLARLAAREPHVSTIRRLAVVVVHADRHRRAATRERATGVIGIFPPARRRPAPRPHDLR